MKFQPLMSTMNKEVLDFSLSGYISVDPITGEVFNYLSERLAEQLVSTGSRTCQVIIDRDCNICFAPYYDYKTAKYKYTKVGA